MKVLHYFRTHQAEEYERMSKCKKSYLKTISNQIESCNTGREKDYAGLKSDV
jgi:hypothetical protein